MQKQNWLVFEDVCEQKYMKSIFGIITSRTQPVKEKLNPTYFTLYCNRLVAALAN
jgi:hypothetical protein